MEMHLLQVALCLAAVVAPTVALFDIEHDQIDGNANFKVIEIDNGFIRGKKEVTLFEKKAYYAFKGIPYGRAPIGELRFKVCYISVLWLLLNRNRSWCWVPLQPPQKAQPWQGTLDVFEFGNECVQPSVTLEWKGDEDCLFLNVYTPAGNLIFDSKFTCSTIVYLTNFSSFYRVEKPLKPLAVIMYIHFGAFYSGSGNIYGPDFLIDNNVIVVKRQQFPYIRIWISERFSALAGDHQLSRWTVWLSIAGHSRIFGKYGPQRPGAGIEMGP